MKISALIITPYRSITITNAEERRSYRSQKQSKREKRFWISKNWEEKDGTDGNQESKGRRSAWDYGNLWAGQKLYGRERKPVPMGRYLSAPGTGESRGAAMSVRVRMEWKACFTFPLARTLRTF